jgi:hypothetical protein
MIFDPATQTLIDNQGWVDKGGLWIYDLATKAERLMPIEGAAYLTIRAGADGLFRLTHHQSPEQTVSIRHMSDPQRVLASVALADPNCPFTGDRTLWNKVEPALVFSTSSAQRLLRIDGQRESCLELNRSWYNGDNYDLDYQGLVDCITPPGANFVIVAVQRSSTLILVDYVANAKCGEIELAGRRGNPKLRMRSNFDFLASDHDTMCLVNLRDMGVVASECLQGATAGWIGDYSEATRNAIAVARPHSGDVIIVDATTFAQIDRIQVPDQPLKVAMISDREIVTRDWKTGRVAHSRF